MIALAVQAVTVRDVSTSSRHVHVSQQPAFTLSIFLSSTCSAWVVHMLLFWSDGGEGHQNQRAVQLIMAIVTVSEAVGSVQYGGSYLSAHERAQSESPFASPLSFPLAQCRSPSSSACHSSPT